MDMGHRQSAPLLEKMYQFVLWVIPTVEKFPRSQKFLLGDRIRNTVPKVLEGLIEAAYTKNRAPILVRVNQGLEKLRFLFRVTHDLRFLDARRYEFAARYLEEIGRMVGGWRKASHAQET